tara:strand:- start:1416 stop:2015 length:600 start_codon:yes stop_codon:yes gene_type:complete
MDKKTYIQISLIISVLIIVSCVYFFYFKNAEKKIVKTVEQTDGQQVVKGSDDLITDMTYLSEDNKGNKYEIKSEYSVISPKASNLIIMDKVKAIIYLTNGEKIFISSNKANYDETNNDTTFNGSVQMIYSEHVVNADSLDLSFKNNLATLYNNVKYKSKLSTLSADKILIDFLNKNTKIEMNDANNKVLVRSLIKNGNN